MPETTPSPDVAREERTDLVGALSQRRPFSFLSRSQLEWLLDRARPARHAAGQLVLGSGAPADRLHIVRSGTIEIATPGQGEESTLSGIVAGDCFPLEELHAERPTVVGYRARTDAECVELPLQDFRALQAESQEFRASCERRSRRFFEKLRRIQQAQLAEMGTVVSQLSMQRSGAEEIANAIRRARDIKTLAKAAQAIRDLARLMMVRGIVAGQITRLVSAMNDRVTERVVQLEVQRGYLADVDFCWIALGSEGRMEQTLCTDQDNGIVFEPRPAEPLDALRERLLLMARRINAALAECGFPLCKGEVMAGNPAWCLGLEEWREKFSQWMDRPEPVALLNASIFFDLRPVFGNLQLGAGLQAWLASRAPGNRRFLALMAQNALETRPPLGFLGGLAVEKGGANPGTIELKRDAIRIFVDAARILGLATGSAGPSTEQRLREAGARSGVSSGQVEAWIEAFQYVQVLRFRHHYDLSQAGKELDNRIDPRRLNSLEQRFLIESLRQARTLQDRVARAYRLDGAAGL
jgi:CBS domain-containing protein